MIRDRSLGAEGSSASGKRECDPSFTARCSTRVERVEREERERAMRVSWNGARVKGLEQRAAAAYGTAAERGTGRRRASEAEGCKRRDEGDGNRVTRSRRRRKSRRDRDVVSARAKRRKRGSRARRSARNKRKNEERKRDGGAASELRREVQRTAAEGNGGVLSSMGKKKVERKNGGC